MAEIVVKYRPQGNTLRKFHGNRDLFVRVLIGPLGSGKTQACISELLQLIDSQAPDSSGTRRSRWVAARNTYPDLINTTIKDFKEWTDGMGLGKVVMSSPPRWECKYQKKDGTKVEAEVLFLAFDLPDDQKKARGLQLSGVWLNEMKELSRTNCDMLMSRVGRYPSRARVPQAHSCVIGDSNAPDRDHWLAQLALDDKPDGWWFGIQPPGVVKNGLKWAENPDAENIGNLKHGYYQRLLAGRPESWIRQNLANQFVFHADGRPVQEGFNEALHVRPVEFTPGLPLILGVDFGRTPACAILQRQPNGRWMMKDEIITENTSVLTFGKIVRQYLNDRYPNYRIGGYGDPAGTAQAQTRDETPFDMMSLAGVDLWPAPSNDFEERVTVVNQALSKLIDGEPAFIIDPACKVAIRGLAGAYQFKRVQVSGEYKYHDKPVKDKTSHICEAIQYGLLGSGEGDNLFSQPWEEFEAQMTKETGGWYPNPQLFE
jgi:hypothetical protein